MRVAEAGERLVGGVVDHLLDDVQRVVGARVHARPLLDGLQALEHPDRRLLVPASGQRGSLHRGPCERASCASTRAGPRAIAIDYTNRARAGRPGAQVRSPRSPDPRQEWRHDDPWIFRPPTHQRGRRAAAAGPVRDARFSGAFGRADAARRPGDWRSRSRTARGRSRRWTWDEFEALPRRAGHGDIHCVTKWSKFDTAWEGVLRRRPVRRRRHRAADAFVLAHSLRRLRHQRADRRPGRRQGDGRHALRRPADRRRARRAGAAAGAASVFLEERQVGATACRFTDARRGGLLGVARLSHATAIRGASSATPTTERRAAATRRCAGRRDDRRASSGARRAS